MKYFLALILLMVAATNLMAQNEIKQSIANLSIEAAATGGFFREGSYEGTPYADKEPTKGMFYQTNKTVVETQTRLNNFRNSFEFVVDGTTYLVAANTIDSVVVNQSTYLFRTFSFNGTSQPRVVKLVGKNGNSSLYTYTHVEFLPEVKPGGYIDPKPARFDWTEPVYVFELNKQVIPLTNFKKLTDAFPAREDEIKKYIKKNKTSKTNPEDLLKLLGYVGSL